MKVCIRWNAGVFALLALCYGGTAKARPFRFDELARVQRVGAFSVSPDGQWITYAVSTPDVAENRSRSAIWLVATGGGAPRRLTSGEKRDSDPAFSPDGKTIAFLSNREGSSQIWRMDLSGGEAQKATSFPTDVNGFKWSPDGRFFVIAADVFPDCTDTACLEKRFKAREKAVVKGRVAERLLFRHWDAWQDGLRGHLWKVPASGSAPAVDLTPGDRDAPAKGIEPREGGGMGKQIHSKAAENGFLFGYIEQHVGRRWKRLRRRVADRANRKHREIVRRANLGQEFRFHVHGRRAGFPVETLSLFDRLDHSRNGL